MLPGQYQYPTQCERDGLCCVVLMREAKGVQCNPVPIWDFTHWTHAGTGAVVGDRKVAAAECAR